MVGAAGMVGFLLVLATVIMSFLAILVLSVAGFSAAVKNPESVEAMAKALGPTGQSILFLLFFGFFLGLVYVAIRLSLVPAAIVSRKRISVFDTWGLTKGQFWPLLAATILTNAPSLGLALIISPLTSGPGGVSLPIAVLAAAATGLVGAFIQLPLNVGLTAFLFRGLRPATERPGQGVF
jgi:hypothetical protein